MKTLIVVLVITALLVLCLAVPVEAAPCKRGKHVGNKHCKVRPPKSSPTPTLTLEAYPPPPVYP